MRVETSGAVSHRGVQPFAPSRAPKATRGHKVGLAGGGGAGSRATRCGRDLGPDGAASRGRGLRARGPAPARAPCGPRAGGRARGPRPLCALGRRTRRGRLRPGDKAALGGRGLVRGGPVDAAAGSDLRPTWSLSGSQGGVFPWRSRRQRRVPRAGSARSARRSCV